MLEALTEALDATQKDDVLPTLDTWFHRNDLLGVWAAEIVTSNADSYVTHANHSLLYHPPHEGRWSMIPWGPDQSFYKDWADEVGVYDDPHGRLVIDCRNDEACSAALDSRIEDVLVAWELTDMPAFVEQTTLAIEEACRADPRSNYGDYGCRDAQEAMRAWVDARPDIVRAELSAQ